MAIDLTGRLAIVTGAGGGLGRAHALLLAKRGAKVVVNDLPGDGALGSTSAAASVADEIVAAGGEAIPNGASVADFGQVEEMVAAAMECLGAVHCSKAVWPIMRAQNYGRIVMTTSSSGLYGNFGQTNYAAAKMARVGLMQTLSLEGDKNGICVNCFAPTAATRMMDGLLAPDLVARLKPEATSPGVLVLVADDAPTRTILCAGAGSFEQAHITLTRGVYIGDGDDAAEQVASRLAEIGDVAASIVPASSRAQAKSELEKAGMVVA